MLAKMEESALLLINANVMVLDTLEQLALLTLTNVYLPHLLVIQELPALTQLVPFLAVLVLLVILEMEK